MPPQVFFYLEHFKDEQLINVKKNQRNLDLLQLTTLKYIVFFIQYQ